MRSLARYLPPALLGLITLVPACSAPATDGAADSAAIAAARGDSLAKAAADQAVTMLAGAKATLAELLADPASATFDSLVVVQPPAVTSGGRLPGLAVCGRLDGKPGIADRDTPTRFIYQGRFTVFVEDARNQAEFGVLWQRTCAAPGREVVLRG